MYNVVILLKNGEILWLTELDDFRLNGDFCCYIAETKTGKLFFDRDSVLLAGSKELYDSIVWRKTLENTEE